MVVVLLVRLIFSEQLEECFQIIQRRSCPQIKDIWYGGSKHKVVGGSRQSLVELIGAIESRYFTSLRSFWNHNITLD